jgi:hypothetical protein
LKVLLDKPEPDAPAFMSAKPWQIKTCQTVLGGWAQLRHTWILQAKESYETLDGIGKPPPGFVEPVPEFYFRLRELVHKTAKLLKKRGAFIVDTKRLVKDIWAMVQLLEEKKPVPGILKASRLFRPRKKCS